MLETKSIHHLRILQVLSAYNQALPQQDKIGVREYCEIS